MVKEIQCDLFKSGANVIIHGCNIHCTMGAGLALFIKENFPEAYRADCQTKEGDISKLGTFSIAKVTNPKYPKVKWIINLYQQATMGGMKRNVSYDALVNGLEAIRELLLERKGEKLIVGIPHGLGAGLANGSWSIIDSIICEIFEESPIQVLICQKTT